MQGFSIATHLIFTMILSIYLLGFLNFPVHNLFSSCRFSFLFLREAFFDSQRAFCCPFHFSFTPEILFTSAVVPARVPYFIRFVFISFIHAAARNKSSSVAFTFPDDLFCVSCRVTIWGLAFSVTTILVILFLVILFIHFIYLYI